MNILVVCSAIFVGVVLTSGAPAAEKTCSEAAKALSGLTKEFHEPKGTWKVYKSNKAKNGCTTLTYEPLDINGTHVAKVSIKGSGENATEMEAVVTVVPGDTNQYVAVGVNSGDVRIYHRLHPDVSTEKRHFFCAFECDDDDEEDKFVKSFTCFIDNEEIMPQVDKDIEAAKEKLPFAPDFKLTNVYDTCAKSNDKPKSVVEKKTK